MCDVIFPFLCALSHSPPGCPPLLSRPLPLDLVGRKGRGLHIPQTALQPSPSPLSRSYHFLSLLPPCIGDLPGSLPLCDSKWRKPAPKASVQSVLHSQTVSLKAAPLEPGLPGCGFSEQPRFPGGTTAPSPRHSDSRGAQRPPSPRHPSPCVSVFVHTEPSGN